MAWPESECKKKIQNCFGIPGARRRAGPLCRALLCLPVFACPEVCHMGRLAFTVQAEDRACAARATTFRTLHGTIETPLFMPVGTNATVKGLRPDDLHTVGSQMLLANTYHLLLRPGPDVFEKIGGIHRMMNWSGSVLTDSGGFQIFSLPNARQMTEDGALFRSYVDGSQIRFTPEASIAMQRSIGSDIMMVLDQCIPSTADHTTATEAMRLTHRWAARSLRARGDSPQSLFGIVQGALHRDLRRESVETLAAMDFDGLAIGGLAVGETKDQREEFTAFTADLMPRDRPRYLMGVGTPIDLLEAVHSGVDMFDCIIPSALSRQAVAYTSRGRLRLRRTVYRLADEPLDPDCSCSTCRGYSKAYLNHLHKSDELLGWQLISIHNLTFYHSLMAQMRRHILSGSFDAFYRSQRELLVRQDEDRPPGPGPRVRKQKRFSCERLGGFSVQESSDGFVRIRHTESGEVMHPGTDPNDEARRLYVEQSRLKERLENGEDLVVWDVGLGAAYNAMAAIRAGEQTATSHGNGLTGQGSLRIVSFENDLDALRLALLHVARFPHLRHAAPHVLLRNRSWQSKDGRIQWTLIEGDFRSQMHHADSPALIFYDPYSYRTNGDLWTLAVFEPLFGLCQHNDVELFSYTAATRIRATLLGAGFHVASGAGTGPKMDTTVALTERAARRRQTTLHPLPMLGQEWLGRWERSDSRYPSDLPEQAAVLFAERLRMHPQFLQTALQG